MLRKEFLEIVDRACRDQLPAGHRAENVPFAGKVLILGGDWQQLLPVVSGEGLAAQTSACVKSSDLFSLFRTVRLIQNMRVHPNEIAFLRLLGTVGADTGPKRGRFIVPPAMRETSVDALIDFVYDQGAILNDPLRLSGCMLLALKRADVRLLNDRILEMLPGQAQEFLSADAAIDDNPLDTFAANHDVATLNDVDVSSMPPHRLRLKIGAIIVLLRNIDVYRGLSNGTRMVVEHISHYYIVGRIIAGPYAGQQHMLQNYNFTYMDPRVDGSGIRMTRFQLPIMLAFAMTVNKAQGQTVERLGLYLRDNVFSHGQLYVALSRVRSADSLRIYMQD